MIEKVLSILMIPVGMVILFEELGLFSVDFFMDKILIGAILLIVVQVVALITLTTIHQGSRIVSYVSFVVLIAPAVLYLIPGVSFSFQEQLPLIIGVMMFVEGMYALH